MKNWKYITIGILLLVCAGWIMMVSFDKRESPPAYHPVQFFNKTGQQFRITKVFTDTLTPNTSNGYSIDISPAGFTGISSVNVVAQRNTSTATSVPNVGIKSYTTSAVVVNITEGNASLINILGSNVLLGPSTSFATIPGVILQVQVLGW